MELNSKSPVFIIESASVVFLSVVCLLVETNVLPASLANLTTCGLISSLEADYTDYAPP